MPPKNARLPFIGKYGKPVSCLCGKCPTCLHRECQLRLSQKSKLRNKNPLSDKELERLLVEKFQQCGWD